MEARRAAKLSKDAMKQIIEKYWAIAYITKGEDPRIRDLAYARKFWKIRLPVGRPTTTRSRTKKRGHPVIPALGRQARGDARTGRKLLRRDHPAGGAGAMTASSP
jgi:hypothetical protein